MSKQYQPIKKGKSGTKVHAGEIVDWMQKGHYAERRPVYDSLCVIVNTHNINQRVGFALLPTGTKITCQACLERMEKESK